MMNEEQLEDYKQRLLTGAEHIEAMTTMELYLHNTSEYYRLIGKREGYLSALDQLRGY